MYYDITSRYQQWKNDRMPVNNYALFLFSKEDDKTHYPRINSIVQIQNVKEFMGQKIMQ